METRPSFEPELAALAAALLLGGIDASLLLAAGVRGSGPLLTAIAVCLSLALPAALSCRLARGGARWLGGGLRGRLLMTALLSLAPLLYISIRLFQGTGISTRWYAPYGPYLVAPLLLGLTLLLVAVAAPLLSRARRSRAGRALLGAVLLLGAALSGLLDGRLYPNQYAYLHALLLAGTGAGLLGAAWLALPLPGSRRPWRWLAPALLVASLVLLAGAARSGLEGQREMQILAERTHASGRLTALLRRALDLDHDRFSVVFGERDCDNGNAAVHPFALDIPANGVDEDCDGRDASPAPPRPSRAPGLAEYAGVLERLREAPAVRAHLKRTAGYNVILIVLDALRASEVQPTAENRQNHPNLLGLLGQSRWFVRTFSTGAGTDIGMATVFTGQLDPFDPHHRGLFQAYSDAGFRTHGVFQREVERWVGRQFALKGLQGRKTIVNDPGRRDVGTQPTSVQVTDEGIRFLRERAEEPGRFLLWMHYFDIHEHHQINPGRLPDPSRYRAPRGRPFYRSLVRFIDAELGRLLAALEESGLGGRTIVAVLGDHGEGLGDSPRLPANHGDVLYNPLVHVPMALRVPGLEGAEVRVAVSLADLYPTLLELSGIASPPGYGLSLLPFLVGGAPPRELRGFVRPVVMYETRQRALLLWPWKLIAWQDSGRVELYDLSKDYAEEQNLADERPERARELARQLGGYSLVTIDRLTKRR